MSLFSGCNGTNRSDQPTPQRPATSNENSLPPFVCHSQASGSPILAKVGDSVTAANGVTVTVRDVFQPADPISPDDFIKCFDFSIGSQPLHPFPMCARDHLFSKFDGESCSKKFADFGVTIEHWPVEGGRIPLIVQAETPVLDSPGDLFMACLNAGHTALKCYRYTVSTPLPYEETGTSFGYPNFFSFYPADEIQLGGYFVHEWPRCRLNIHDILAPDLPPPPEGHLRVHFDSGNSVPGDLAFVGKAVPENNVILNYLKGLKADLEKNVKEYLPANDALCRDPILYHESAHLEWATYSSPYVFWLPLQEGAARYLELHPPSRPQPKKYADTLVTSENPFEILLPSDNGELFVYVGFLKETVDGAAIAVYVNETPENPETMIGAVFQISEPTLEAIGKGYKLLVNTQALSDGMVLPHIQIVRLDYNGMQNGMMRLTCNADSYNVDGGIWMNELFYKDKKFTQNQPAMGLHPFAELNHFEPDQAIYNSGACFFDGLSRLYGERDSDFGTFFPQLTAAIHAFGLQPLSNQYTSKFCVLPTIQSILDADLGPGVLDITAYTTPFGYDPKKPWCSGPETLYNTDRFGQTVSWY